MKTEILFIPLVFLSWLMNAKETKKITHMQEFPAIKEVFYVLKSDTAVKHGSYKVLSQKLTMMKGYYKMGLKDSIWIQYNHRRKIRSRGWYEKGERVRTWEFFDNDGKLEQKIDFTSKTVPYYHTSLANKMYKIISGKDTTTCLPDRPPMYIGGTSRFNDCVAEQMNPNPLHKANEKVSGWVYVALTIDSLGKSSNHHVLKGIGHVCDQEAIRAITAIPDEWLPGILEGKTISVEYVVPFQFNLNRKQTKLQPGEFSPDWKIDNEGYFNSLNIPRGLQEWNGNGENTQLPE